MTPRESNALQPRQSGRLDSYVPETQGIEEPPFFDLRKYGAILRRRRWVIIATMLAVFALGMARTMIKRPIYESTAGIVVLTNAGGVSPSENDVPILGDLQALTRSRSVETQVELIASPDLANEAFESLDGGTRSSGFGSSAVPDWAYRVSPKKGTDIIQITARAYTPGAAADLANTMAATYFNRDLRQNSLATRQARRYTEQRMRVAENELSRANADLASFKEESGLFAPATQFTTTAQQAAQLKADLNQAQAEMAAAERQASTLRAQMAGEKQTVPASTTVGRNPQYDVIVARIDGLKSQRVSLLQEYTAESREVRAIGNQIAQEEQRLREFDENVVTSTMQARNPVRDDLVTSYASHAAAASAARARASAIETALNSSERATRVLPRQELQYARRQEKVALLQKAYETLSDKYYALLLREQATMPSGMLVARARPAASPAYPNARSSAVFYLLLGAVLAVAIALVTEWRDTRIHDQAVMEQVSELPTLSFVPEVSVRSPQLLGRDGRDGALLESFRILRNNVLLTGIDSPKKMVAVTSPGRGDGKSTSAINLAVVMAMEGKKVLLVDADMRRPSLYRFFGLPRDRGLTTVVTGSSTLQQAVCHTETENLFVLPAGPVPPNPPEVLNSKPSRELFSQLPEIYDMVIIDSPPAAGLSDVQVISTFVDGVVMVVSADRTLIPHLQIAVKGLMQVGAPLIGMVLNRADINLRGCGYYDYCDAHALPAPGGRKQTVDTAKRS